jgi:tripartite-type tricarboxylate transporter receptor subunit TctC
VIKAVFRSIAVAVLAVLPAVFPGAAVSQEYPNRPAKILVPYAAGGAADTVARITAQRISETLGQQFVVENRPGAGGIGAAVAVAKSVPDGYTLLLAESTQVSLNPFLFSKLPYDPVKDFAPVSLIVRAPVFLLVHPSANINSVPDLIAAAKAHPGKLNYASSGIGSIHHIGMEAFKAALGLDIVHVPFKGAGQSVPAFLGEGLTLLVAAAQSVESHVAAGKAKYLTVFADTRSPSSPNTPAAAEFVPGYDFTSQMGILAPAGTPPAIVAKLSAEIAKSTKHADTVRRLAGAGLEPVGSTPEAYGNAIRRNLEKFEAAVRISGAKSD